MPDPCLVEINPPFTGWDWHVVHDEDINDPLPQFLDEDGDPFDLTGKVVEVYIRPIYDHTVLIKKLTSAGSAGITIDDAAAGLCTARLPRATVQTDLPVGSWDFFLVVTDAGAYSEFARGPFLVHPGRTT